mgnify:CR=1 FL=1
MSDTLQMIFSNALGRSTTISVADPSEDLTPAEVEAVMDSIVTKNIFNSTGGDLVGKVRAQVVSRTVDVLGEY